MFYVMQQQIMLSLLQETVKLWLGLEFEIGQYLDVELRLHSRNLGLNPILESV